MILLYEPCGVYGFKLFGLHVFYEVVRIFILSFVFIRLSLDEAELWREAAGTVVRSACNKGCAVVVVHAGGIFCHHPSKHRVDKIYDLCLASEVPVQVYDP